MIPSAPAEELASSLRGPLGANAESVVMAAEAIMAAWAQQLRLVPFPTLYTWRNSADFSGFLAETVRGAGATVHPPQHGFFLLFKQRLAKILFTEASSA